MCDDFTQIRGNGNLNRHEQIEQRENNSNRFGKIGIYVVPILQLLPCINPYLPTFIHPSTHSFIQHPSPSLIKPLKKMLGDSICDECHTQGVILIKYLFVSNRFIIIN